MDGHSWLWRRKSPEKSPGESESSGSVSSHSERSSDDQEASRASLIVASPNHVQSPKVPFNIPDTEAHDTFKSLSEKLSAALLEISAQEDLAKQHAKVAEEAVAGWEKAENEVAELKQQLEATAHENSALEDRISYLDGALKECVKQLRQSRETQDQKIHDALIDKTYKLESDKSMLESQLVELQAQLEASKSEVSTSTDYDLHSRLEALEKENSNLKVGLLARYKDLEIRTLERDLSIQSAETASKQQLESIKKVAKLEAECRRLQAVARRSSSSSVNDYKPLANSVCVESLSDSQLNNSELDNEPSCSDSWASALIAELDQFKNKKASTRNDTASVEIDLMDDFLEMERLVALPEDNRSSSFKLGNDSNQAVMRESTSKIELEVVQQQMAELEEQVKKMESEKEELEMTLANTKSQLETSCNQLMEAEGKLVDLQKQLQLVHDSKQVAAIEIVAMESKWKESESLLNSAQLEIEKLHEMAALLERKLDEERALSAEFSSQAMAFEATGAALESQLESAYVDVRKLHEKLGFSEGKFEEEKARSAGLEAKVEALEAMSKALESQLESAHLDTWELRDRVCLLDGKLEEERALSSRFSVKVEDLEVKIKELEWQLESANLEVGKLHDKVGFLEGKVEEERASSAAFATKCQNLENELARKKQAAELRRVASYNGELKIKQEKELAAAADKLVECQKTMASLGRQLESLTNLDDLTLEAMKPEVNGCFQDVVGSDVNYSHSNYSSVNLGVPTLSNGRDRGSPPSSSSSLSSSSLSGFAKLLSRSRSSRIENQ